MNDSDPKKLKGLYSRIGHTHPGSGGEPPLGNPSVDGDILSSTVAGVRSWIAPPSGGVSDFIDLADVPHGYAGAGGKIVKVKGDASGLEFGAGGGGGASAFTDLSDVPNSYEAEDAGKVVQVNASHNGLEFATPGSSAVSDDDIAFLDTFSDASIYWAWTAKNTSAAKTIVESGGFLTLHVDAGTSCDWAYYDFSAPVIYIGADPPCEFIVKMNSITAGKSGGIFVSRYFDAGPNTFFLEPQADGYHVTQAGTVDHGAVGGTPTFPVYLKIRITMAHYYHNIITFWYSADGTTWTQYSSGGFNQIVGFGGYEGLGFGLITRGTGLIDAAYDWVKLIRSRGPR